MKKIIVIILMLFSSAVHAQTKKATFEIEIDPLAYVLKGYSVHGIYQPGKLRFDAGAFGLEIPKGLDPNKDFTVKMDGIGAKVHYLLQGTKGFYTGFGVGYFTLNARHKTSGDKARGTGISFGPELGYRFFFKNANENIKGLYLMPWISYGYNHYLKEVKFEGRDFKTSNWQPFATFHIGYRF